MGWEMAWAAVRNNVPVILCSMYLLISLGNLVSCIQFRPLSVPCSMFPVPCSVIHESWRLRVVIWNFFACALVNENSSLCLKK